VHPANNEDLVSGTRSHQALPAGYKIHWYEIDSVLGQGGFGITYLAHDTNLNQQVAVKEYLPAELATRTSDETVHPITDGHVDTYGWGLSRFISEAQTLAQFRHPHIVRVQSVFEMNNTAYMIMEYEEGRSFAQALNFNILATEADLRRVLLEMLDGLEAIHAAGFIHRDIKPDNIYLRDDGSAVLLDFGSARQAVGGETRTLTALVTPGYAPYEQYGSGRDDDRQGPWTDIYGLGATFYRAVTGRGPMDAMTRVNAILDGKPDPLIPALSHPLPQFGAALLASIDHALAFHPKDRPQTVTEWRADLERSNEVAETMRVPMPVPDVSRARTGNTGQPSGRDTGAAPNPIATSQATRRTTGRAPGQTTTAPGTDATVLTGQPQKASTNPILWVALAGVVSAIVAGATVFLVVPADAPYTQAPTEIVSSGGEQTSSTALESQTATPDKVTPSEQPVTGTSEPNTKVTTANVEVTNVETATAPKALTTDEAQTTDAKTTTTTQQSDASGSAAIQVASSETSSTNDVARRGRESSGDVSTDAVPVNIVSANTEETTTRPAVAGASTQAVTSLKQNSLVQSATQQGDTPRTAESAQATNLQTASAPNAGAQTTTAPATTAPTQPAGTLMVPTAAVTNRAANDQAAIERAARENAAVQQAATKPPPAPPVNPNAERIRNLLTRASADVNRSRLTSPAGNNATERYREVLQLDPGNVAATEGLDAVVDAYIKLANRDILLGKTTNAQRYLAKARTIRPNSPALDDADARFATAVAKEQQRRANARQTEATAEARRQADARAREAADQKDRQRLADELAQQRRLQEMRAERKRLEAERKRLATARTQPAIQPTPVVQPTPRVQPTPASTPAVLSPDVGIRQQLANKILHAFKASGHSFFVEINADGTFHYEVPMLDDSVDGNWKLNNRILCFYGIAGHNGLGDWCPKVLSIRGNTIVLFEHGREESWKIRKQ
jgi:serine/threonine protein kinase/tetratricopeptide (TPR) repeat protein